MNKGTFCIGMIYGIFCYSLLNTSKTLLRQAHDETCLMAPKMVQPVPLPTPLRFPANSCNRLAKLHDKIYAVEPNAMPSTSKPLDLKLFANRAASRTKTPSMCGPRWLKAAKSMHGSTRPTCSCIVGSGFGV